MTQMEKAIQDGEALEKVEAEVNAKTPRYENAEREDPSDPSMCRMRK